MSSQWTRESPEKSGYYWFVDMSDFPNPDATPTVVHVRGKEGQMPEYFKVEFLKRLDWKLLKETIGCWYGPIPMPEYHHCPGW